MKTALTVLVVTIIVGIGYWLMTGGIPRQETPLANAPTMNTYKSADSSLRLDYPLDVLARPISSGELSIAGGAATTTILYPAGSIEIPGLFVISKIPFSEFSVEDGIYDYYSCCSGVKYSYDETKKEWRGDEIYYDPQGPTATSFRPQSLVENGTCRIKQVYGANTYYVIPSGDEGIPTDYYYFLLTDQGYGYRFLSRYDLQDDFSTYAEELRPDPRMIREASDVLASVVLEGGVKEVNANCL